MKVPVDDLWCVVCIDESGDCDPSEVEFFPTESAALVFAQGVVAADGLAVYVTKVHWVL